jgi:hypothetical protein
MWSNGKALGYLSGSEACVRKLLRLARDAGLSFAVSRSFFLHPALLRSDFSFMLILFNLRQLYHNHANPLPFFQNFSPPTLPPFIPPSILPATSSPNLSNKLSSAVDACLHGSPLFTTSHLIAVPYTIACAVYRLFFKLVITDHLCASGWPEI